MIFQNCHAKIKIIPCGQFGKPNAPCITFIAAANFKVLRKTVYQMVLLPEVYKPAEYDKSRCCFSTFRAEDTLFFTIITYFPKIVKLKSPGIRNSIFGKCRDRHKWNDDISWR